MSKVSIVGVEGCGKTTLMAVFGKLYERPNENGYGLRAKTRQTLDVIERIYALLCQGKWPAATEKGVMTSLDWTLYQRSEGKGCVKVQRKCWICNGSGEVSASVSCPRCDGEGHVRKSVRCDNDDCQDGKVWANE